jgi:hypothetical protein
MPILSKGHTFATGNQVTAGNLNALVDSATFVAGAGGATDNSSLEVFNGVIRVKNAGITPTLLSAGAPAWVPVVGATPANVAIPGNQTIQGTLDVGTSIATTGTITCNGNLSTNGNLTLLSTGQINTSAPFIGRTVKLNSGTGGNNIQFGFQNDGSGTFLLVTIDGTNEYKVALTAV